MKFPRFSLRALLWLVLVCVMVAWWWGEYSRSGPWPALAGVCCIWLPALAAATAFVLFS